MKRLVVILYLFLLAGFALSGQSYFSPPGFVMEKDSTATEPQYSYEGLQYRMVCELEGREIIGRPQPLVDMPVQSGDIVLEIKVNRYGEVSLVSLVDKGTTIIDRDLIDDVCDDAMNTLFNESGTAPVFQMGRMIYHFDIPVAAKDTVFIQVDPAFTADSTGVGGIGKVLDRPAAAERKIPLPVEEHLEFKKVYIDGPLPEFMNALRNTGLTYRGIREGMGFLEGTFAGINNARICAMSINDETYKVVVDFPGQETWPSMKKQYLYFKRSFASKYFSTPHSVEKFPHFIPEGSGREHNAFREEAAVYSSSFDVPNGTIIISVQPSSSGDEKFFLRIEYIDEKNSSRREQEALEDI